MIKYFAKIASITTLFIISWQSILGCPTCVGRRALKKEAVGTTQQRTIKTHLLGQGQNKKIIWDKKRIRLNQENS